MTWVISLGELGGWEERLLAEADDLDGGGGQRAYDEDPGTGLQCDVPAGEYFSSWPTSRTRTSR